MTYKPGQRVEVSGFDWNFNETWESAKVCKPRPENLPKPGEDWYVIRFEDGGKLYVHESQLRAV